MYCWIGFCRYAMGLKKYQMINLELWREVTSSKEGQIWESDSVDGWTKKMGKRASSLGHNYRFVVPYFEGKNQRFYIFNSVL